MKKIMILILLVCLIGGGAFLLVDKLGLNSRELNYVGSVKTASQNVINSIQDQYVAINNDKIFKITKESVQCFEITSSNVQKVLWQENSYIKNPVVKNNSNYVCVFDKLGYNGTMYDASGKIYDIKTTLPILEVSINKLGQTAVLQKEESKSMISIFDENGKKKVERVSYQEKGGIPIAVAISEKGDTFASSYLDVSENIIISKVTFFKIDGKELRDNLFASFEYTDSIVTNLKYINNDDVIAVADNKLIKINLFSSVDQKVELEEKIKDVILDCDDSIILICSKKANQLSADTTYLEFYNYNLSKKKENIIYNMVTCMNTNKSKLTVGKGKEIYAFSKSGFELWRNSFSIDVWQILTFPKSNLVLVVTSKGLDMYRLQMINVMNN